MDWVLIGALLGFLGVGAGAFGAHGLRGFLPPDRMEVFEVAVRYQIYHALALVLCGTLKVNRAGWGFFLGVVIFSGSLYLLVLTDRRWLGAITPLGGLLLLFGWAALGWSRIR